MMLYKEANKSKMLNLISKRIFLGMLILLLLVLPGQANDIASTSVTYTPLPLNKEVQIYYQVWAPINEYTKINYNLVSTIAYAGVGLHYDGSHTVTLVKYDNYNTEVDNLIAYAHKRGVKVVLTFMTNKDADKYFISDSQARASAVNALLTEVRAHNFDGVDDDIENTVAKADMTAFQSLLADTFWANNPNYRVSFTISFSYSKVDKIYNFSVLKNKANYIYMMGYDYTWQTSPNAGPVGPILDDILYPGYGISVSLTHYLGEGVPPNKMILGVPYYGYVWPTIDSSKGSSTTGVGIYTSIQTMMNNSAIYGRRWDTKWQTPWYTYQSGGHWYQGHYDDIQSLGIKYDLANSKGLAGIGIWAIDYATDYPKLWQLIQDKFTNASPVLTSITVSPTGASISIGSIQAFSAQGKDQFGNPMPAIVSWISSNTGVGTINSTGNSTGLFTAFATGSTNITAISGAVTGTTSVTITSKSTNLVGYWKFDNSSGTRAVDSSGNGNTGALINFQFDATDGWISCKVNNCLRFDGANDYINIPSNTSLKVTYITVEAWVYPITNASGTRRIITQARDAIGNWAAYSLYQSKNSVMWGIKNTTDTGISNIVSFTIPINAWTHIAGVYDGSKIKIYSNGVLAQSANKIGNIDYIGINPLLIGETANVQYFNGSIDEIKIYNRALSDSEIFNDYNVSSIQYR